MEWIDYGSKLFCVWRPTGLSPYGNGIVRRLRFAQWGLLGMRRVVGWIYHTSMIISRNPSPPSLWRAIMLFPACCHLLFTTSPACQFTMTGAQHVRWRMGAIIRIQKASWTDSVPLTGYYYLQWTTCAYSRGGLGFRVHHKAFSVSPRSATVSTQMTLAFCYGRSAC